jgi:CheY-like chemotaxis protein
MAESRTTSVLSALRAAVQPEQGRHLVAVDDPMEQSRIATVLAAEGQVVLETSTRFALDRLDAEPFALAVVDLDEREGRYPLPDLKEARPFSDLVAIIDPDPVRCGEAYAAEVEAVLPRPLPSNDAELGAHLRRLATARRSRTNWLLLRQALSRLGPELSRCEPDLARALAELSDPSGEEPMVAVLGDDALSGPAGSDAFTGTADVVVVAIAAAEGIERGLERGRARAPEGALVVVDAAPSAERLSAALYGGARAYLVRSQVGELGRVVAAVASRLRAELGGRRLVETLALAEGEGREPSVAAFVQDLQSPIAGAPFVPSGLEVLLVDDEAVVLAVLREVLRRGGYRVTTASSGEEAIDLMRRRPFDLVLTDKNLPGLSGLEVGRAARALTAPPAVVLMTGYSSQEAAAAAGDIGAHDFIEKPIADLETFRTRVRRALSRHAQQQSRAPARASEPAGRVLLVEAEGLRRQLMAEFLGRSYPVDSVSNGAEAQQRLQQERFDLVLADRNLPGLSGLRVIEQGQRLLPHCACVLYTAYPSIETVRQAFTQGVDNFCLRPNDDLKSLGQKVAEALRSRGGILLG